MGDNGSYPRCGASNGKGGSCRNRAGLRTTHPDTGLCYQHETNLLSIKPVKNFTNFVDETFKRRVNELMFDDELLNLRWGIAIAHTLLERVEQGQEICPPDQKVAMYNMLLKNLGSLTERHHRIEVEKQAYVKIQVVLAMRDAFTDAVTQLIPDPNLRANFSERISIGLRRSLPQQTSTSS